MRSTRITISVRDVFLLILIVAMVSTFFTYHIGTYTVWINQGQGQMNQGFPEFPPGHMMSGRDDGSAVRKDWMVLGRSLHMDRNKASGEKNPTNILSRLLKIEDEMLMRTRSQDSLVVGKPEELNSENPYVLPSLHRHGHAVVHLQDVQEAGTVIQVNSSLVLCTGNACDNMVSKETDKFLKMNRIPVLSGHLTDPKQLCMTAKEVHQNKEKKSLQPCFIFPQDLKNLQESVNVFPWQSLLLSWKSATVFFNLTKDSVQSLETEDALVSWRLPSSPLMFPGGPLLTLQVLVTSFLPLRVYMYPWLRSSPYPNDNNDAFGAMGGLDETLEYLSETYGLGSSGKWWSSLQVLLLSYLARIEMVVSGASREPKTTYGCARCFQTFDVTVSCSSVRNCFIVEIKNQETGYQEVKQTKYMAEDLVAMLVSRATVAMDVAQALESMKSDTFENEACRKDPSSCLTDRDLIYLLDDRQESLQQGNFVKIYPTSDSFKFTPLLAGIQQYPGNPISPLLGDGDVTGTAPIRPRTTADIHFLLMGMQTCYSGLKVNQEDLTDLTFDIDNPTRNEIPTRIKQLDKQKQTTIDKYARTVCSKDPKDMGLLKGVFSEPNIMVQRVSQQEFRMMVDYDVIIVKLWAHAKSCDNEVRFEEKEGVAGPTKQMLGLGENKVVICVVDTNLSEPAVVNSYSLIIYRQSRTQQAESFSSVLNYQVCALKQDCSLPFVPSEPCGLQRKTPFPVWSDYKKHVFPSCRNGDKQGQWLVPCRNCTHGNSCYWEQARWQPDDCQYKVMKTFDLKHCLSGKRLLFVGDSTNRGILNYIIERINGSLWDWDKTHGMKTYRNLNNNKTSLTFAYYPHFWLPTNHRPKFNKILYQLIKSSMPLENNASTVLVVGGVHWLAKQHVDIIVAALRREGLLNITKVVKGFGAGFHQPMEGMRYVKEEEHEQLLKKEQDIFNFAKMNDFNVVATFNMTMARYKDFMQGKCGCHFHTVTKQGRPNHHSYHVKGDINQAYSEIVINQICDTS